MSVEVFQSTMAKSESNNITEVFDKGPFSDWDKAIWDKVDEACLESILYSDHSSSGGLSPESRDSANSSPINFNTDNLLDDPNADLGFPQIEESLVAELLEPGLNCQPFSNSDCQKYMDLSPQQPSSYYSTANYSPPSYNAWEYAATQSSEKSGNVSPVVLDGNTTYQQNYPQYFNNENTDFTMFQNQNNMQMKNLPSYCAPPYPGTQCFAQSSTYQQQNQPPQYYPSQQAPIFNQDNSSTTKDSAAMQQINCNIYTTQVHQHTNVIFNPHNAGMFTKEVKLA